MVHIVSFEISHGVSSGPLEVECFHNLHGLFKLLTDCYVNEFAVFGLFEYSIHRNTTPSPLFRSTLPLFDACDCD